MNELELAMKEFGLKFDEPFSLKLKSIGYIIGPYIIVNSEGTDDNPRYTMVGENGSGNTFDRLELLILIDILSRRCEVVPYKPVKTLEELYEEMKDKYTTAQFIKNNYDMCDSLSCNECGVYKMLSDIPASERPTCSEFTRCNPKKVIEATLKWAISEGKYS